MINKKSYIIKIASAALLISLLTVMTSCRNKKKTDNLPFTEEKPLIFLADIEFAPYESVDRFGNPIGMHVEIAKRVLKRLDIPYKIISEDFSRVSQDFIDGKGDLIIDVNEEFKGKGIYYGSSVVTYYSLAFAMSKSQEKIHNLKEMPYFVVVGVKPRDYALMLLEKKHFSLDNVSQALPKFGLQAVMSGKYDYYIWGEEPLKYMIREEGYKELKTSHLNCIIPSMRFIGHNQELIGMIDEVYTEMELNGEINDIRNQWINNKSSGRLPFSVILGFITLVVLFAVIIILIFEVRRRIKKISKEAREQYSLMTNAIYLNNIITVFNTKNELMTNITGNLMPEKGLSFNEFLQHIKSDDRPKVNSFMLQLIHGETDRNRISCRWNGGNEDKPDWVYFRLFALAEKNDKGQTENVFCTFYDVTDYVEMQARNKEQCLIFKQMFNQSLIGHAFYDKDGKLIDMNPRMKEIFSDMFDIDKFQKTNLFELDNIKKARDLGEPDILHFCTSHALKDNKGDKWMDMRLYTVYYDRSPLFFGISVIDLTKTRQFYNNILDSEKKIKQANKDITDYADRFNYMLSTSRLGLWKYDIASSRINVSKDFKHMLPGMSLEEAANVMIGESREIWRKDFIEKVNDIDSLEPVNLKIHARYTTLYPHPIWLVLSGMPLVDKNEKKQGYFGILRDVTPLMNVEQQLRNETKRANDSEHLKSVFLANMSHEIRTPLNSIVGFSDLLEQESMSRTDKEEFVRIIKNNCDMLLRLINDIMELSVKDSNGLVMHPKSTDFAKDFNDICQSLEERVSNPNVKFIKDNPFSSFLCTLDTARIQQVITNFVTNAIKYTNEGHIKVGYRYIARSEFLKKENETQKYGLFIYCEDTGTGIPEKKASKVFDRFVKLNDNVKGTGLGLSICKAIAEKCNGLIGVNSKEGEGSTFWIWIPCEEAIDDYV